MELSVHAVYVVRSRCYIGSKRLRCESTPLQSSPRTTPPITLENVDLVRLRIASSTSLMTADDVAKILNIGKPMVYKLARKNSLPSKRSGTTVRFPPNGVLAYYDNM
jgi:excisionase family DNA binding protein